MLRISAEIDLNLPQPNYSEIKEKLDSALDLSAKLGMQPHEGHCHLALAKLYRQSGNLGATQKELSAARHCYEQLGMTFWMAQCAANHFNNII